MWDYLLPALVHKVWITVTVLKKSARFAELRTLSTPLLS
jgi:hypothetical protein